MAPWTTFVKLSGGRGLTEKERDREKEPFRDNFMPSDEYRYYTVRSCRGSERKKGRGNHKDRASIASHAIP